MNNYNKFSFILSILLVSCSSKTPKSPEEGPKVVAKQKETAPPSMEAKQLAVEQETTFVTEFSFDKESEIVKPIAKKKIQEIVAQALERGKIDKVKVITWSDQEYPAKEANKLSSAQIALAHNRNTEIKNYIKELLPQLDIEANAQLINMAERPQFFEKLLSPDDVRIKKALEAWGVKGGNGANKEAGKSSQSIVLVFLKK